MGSSLPSTTPAPGAQAAPLAILTASKLGLTCNVDGHGHNDDDDPYDDEADAEHPGQAAQPPGPVQVSLLHATSRLQRERAETSGRWSSAALWGALARASGTYPVPTAAGAPAAWTQGAGTPTKPAPGWLMTAGSRAKQCRITEPQGGTVDSEGLRRWTRPRLP